ncbi:MAG: VTT domain-containing protein [Candidatus Heimdallarchaeota archaeon]|nr:VTT domain-containing protein [Candidatus Heimdallarchaeota archaeon]
MINILEALAGLSEPLIAILIIVILTLAVIIFGFPKEILMTLAGLLYGVMLGGLINLLGLIGAIILGYESGYYGRLGVDRYRKLQVVTKYEEKVSSWDKRGLLLLRLFPLTPNDILSISCGFVKFKRRPYVIISILSAIPYAFLWSMVGYYAYDVFNSLVSPVYDPSTWIIMFFVLILLGWFLMKQEAKEQ